MINQTIIDIWNCYCILSRHNAPGVHSGEFMDYENMRVYVQNKMADRLAYLGGYEVDQH